MLRPPYMPTLNVEDVACQHGPHQHDHLDAGHVSDEFDFARGSVIASERVSDGYVIASR